MVKEEGGPDGGCSWWAGGEAAGMPPAGCVIIILETTDLGPNLDSVETYRFGGSSLTGRPLSTYSPFLIRATVSRTPSTATSNASLMVSSLDLGSAYETLGMSLITSSRILSTVSGGIARSTASMLTLRRRTSASGMYTECHRYCLYADAVWKNTGMHPATMESNTDRRVHESPGGCRQKPHDVAGGVALGASGGARARKQGARAGRLALRDDVIPDPDVHSNVRPRRAHERHEPLPPLAAHPVLPPEHVGVGPGVEVGRVRHGVVAAVQERGLEHKHRHVPAGRHGEEVVAPVRVHVVAPPEVPPRPAGDEEVVASPHAPPLGTRHEPLRQVHGRGVPGGVVVAPVVAGEVEAGVERDEHGVGHGRVVGEALVLPHPVVEDEVERELVRAVPPGLAGDDAVGAVGERPAEAGVAHEPAHVAPVVLGLAAVADDVSVEARRQVVHVDVPAPARVGAVGAMAHLLHLHRGAEHGELQVEEQGPCYHGEDGEEPQRRQRARRGLLHSLRSADCPARPNAAAFRCSFGQLQANQEALI
ncbi:hypothetical protein SETIT_9G542700v2 [Setaria italica]|uniref:Uncharacterized protein n=1 Tax=Setaria italica TaxID=4555 RepID=A0A368SVW8_SETIT|nr:hypothetical protein SETIT_9G542700v2 [Setaria italica]